MPEKKFRGKLIVSGQLSAGSSTNKTTISNIGDISQGGTASAALGDVTVGGGTSLSAIKVGTISPCFNAIDAGASGAGSAAITGLTTGHKVFVSPCCLEQWSPCLVHISTCPAAGVVKIGLYNSASANLSTSSTCPWAYLAISHA